MLWSIAVTEVDAYNQLREKYGAARARQLLGTMRLLLLFGREDVQKRRLIAVSTFYADLAALRAAGVLEYIEAIERTRNLTNSTAIWPMPTTEQLRVVLQAHLDPLLTSRMDSDSGLTSESLTTAEDLITSLFRIQLHQVLEQMYGSFQLRPAKDPE